MKAFNQYNLQQIKELTRTQFAELIIMAELVHQVPFEIQDPNATPTEDTQNDKMLRKIGETAKENSKIFDFGAENEQLQKEM
jgi:hypothetical protein